MSEKQTIEKPTERIKKRLSEYTKLLREIDNQYERLDSLVLKMTAPSGPDMTGLPRGKGAPSDRTGMMVIRKEALESQIAETIAKERAENAALEAMIAMMDDPDERAAIRLRYFDRNEWEDIAFTLYGDRADYNARVSAYMNRVYKLHGRALLSLAAVLDEVDPPAEKSN